LKKKIANCQTATTTTPMAQATMPVMPPMPPMNNTSMNNNTLPLVLETTTSRKQ
jgi:hypothetical protein